MAPAFDGVSGIASDGLTASSSPSKPAVDGSEIYEAAPGLTKLEFDELKPRFHNGPDGTYLKGFGVRELNEFHYDVARTVVLPPHDPASEAAIKKTVQGVDVVPYSIVTGPQDWVATDLTGEANAHKWQYCLTESDVAEIEAALKFVEESGVNIQDITKPEHFPLPTLGPKLLAVRDEVAQGQGIYLIRGFPVDKLTIEQTATTFYAFGAYWGNVQPQNAKGHMLGHVKDLGTNSSSLGVRPYTTNAPHGYHADNSDLVALLCLKDAQEGGISSWASSVAVHNALLRRGRKDLVEVLTTGKFYVPARNVYGAPEDKWDAGPEGPGPEWVAVAPFLYHHNRLSASFKEGAFYCHYRFPHAAKYTPLEEEALRTFTALAMSDELRLDWKLQPGDIPLLNNLTMLHAKSAFKDSEDPSQARHLLRLWVAVPNGSPLPEDSHYKTTWGSVEVGNRGGYWIGHKYQKHVPLRAEYGDLEVNRPRQLK